MIVSIIVAVAENGVIGFNNELIWHLSDDLKNFKRLTSGHIIIMGRNTHESIGKPLAGRTNIVLSRKQGYKAEGCIVFPLLTEALDYCETRNEEEVFIIGGAQVYNEAINRADKLYLTRVHANPEGDAYFPHIDFTKWSELDRKSVKKNEKNDFDFDILEFEKRSVK
jgi:dihydrofolate reductase